jgi:hypothetical protein
MKLTIFDIINSNLAVNISDGELVYNAISNVIPSDLTICFAGIERVSTAFLNESIGKYANLHPDSMHLVSYIIPAENDIFNDKINDVIENALMGDEYDQLVENATLI